jgi:hypothetical protein
MTVWVVTPCHHAPLTRSTAHELFQWCFLVPVGLGVGGMERPWEAPLATLPSLPICHLLLWVAAWGIVPDCVSDQRENQIVALQECDCQPARVSVPVPRFWFQMLFLPWPNLVLFKQVKNLRCDMAGTSQETLGHCVAGIRTQSLWVPVA